MSQLEHDQNMVHNKKIFDIEVPINVHSSVYVDFKIKINIFEQFIQFTTLNDLEKNISK